MDNAKENIEAIYPLSPMQQVFLFHHLYTGKSELGCIISSGVLRGDFNVLAFQRAWQEVMNRHPALRTSFYWEDLDEPLQVVRRQVKLPWTQQDWRGLPQAEQQVRLAAFLQAEREQGIDLAQVPLIRLALIQLAESTYQLVCTIHHAVVDGWSISLLSKEAFAFYRAFCQVRELHLERPRPYEDYIAWLGRQDPSQAEAFWRQQLKGFSSPTPLGMDQTPDHLEGVARVYDTQRVKLSAAGVAPLQALAQQHRLTLNTLVQGAWALLLSRYSGQSDVVFGIIVSGRPDSLAGVESMVGLFDNMLPMRAPVSPETSLLPWLKQLQARQAELSQYEYTSPAKVQEWSEVPGSSPLYESLLNFENYAGNGVEPESSLEVGAFETNVVSSYPLTLVAQPGPGPELALRLVYLRQRFDVATITQILGHFQTLLEGMAANPEQRLAELLRAVKPGVSRRSRPALDRPRLAARRALVAPRNSLERQLTRIWERVLGIQPIGVTDNFFELGGRSLLAVPLFAQIEKTFGQKLPLASLLQAPTIKQLAALLEQKGGPASRSSLVAIQSQGTRAPFFCVHAVGGHALTYAELAYWLGSDQPFYGLEAPGRDREQQPLTRLEDLAAHYIKEVRTVQPEGPYRLGGLCLGGLVAFEMAQQLQAQREQVALLALFDTPCPAQMNALEIGLQYLNRLAYLGWRFMEHSWRLLQLRPSESLSYLRQRTSNARGLIAPNPVQRANSQAARRYLPKAPKDYLGRITVFLATGERTWFAQDLRLGWSKVAAGGVETHRLPGTHLTILRQPHVQLLAQQLKASLDAAPPGGVGDGQRLIAD